MQGHTLGPEKWLLAFSFHIVCGISESFNKTVQMQYLSASVGGPAYECYRQYEPHHEKTCLREFMTR